MTQPSNPLLADLFKSTTRPDKKHAPVFVAARRVTNAHYLAWLRTLPAKLQRTYAPFDWNLDKTLKSSGRIFAGKGKELKPNGPVTGVSWQASHAYIASELPEGFQNPPPPIFRQMVRGIGGSEAWPWGDINPKKFSNPVAIVPSMKNPQTQPAPLESAPGLKDYASGSPHHPDMRISDHPHASCNQRTILDHSTDLDERAEALALIGEDRASTELDETTLQELPYIEKPWMDADDQLETQVVLVGGASYMQEVPDVADKVNKIKPHNGEDVRDIQIEDAGIWPIKILGFEKPVIEKVDPDAQPLEIDIPLHDDAPRQKSRHYKTLTRDQIQSQGKAFQKKHAHRSLQNHAEKIK